MSGIVDKSVKSSQSVKEHQVGILCLCSFNEGVIKEQLSHVLDDAVIEAKVVFVSDSFFIDR